MRQLKYYIAYTAVGVASPPGESILCFFRALSQQISIAQH
jgi:hypothetical protein